MSVTYSIDTSALMTWYFRRYPPEVFPGLVPLMEKLIADGRLRASEYVKTELGAKNDVLHDWAIAQQAFFVKTDSDVSTRAANLVKAHPLLIDPSSLRPIQADPYVIALAASRKDWIVVTQETFAKTKTSGKRRNKTYVPDVCVAEHILCIDFLDMMRREKWKL